MSRVVRTFGYVDGGLAISSAIPETNTSDRQFTVRIDVQLSKGALLPTPSASKI
jgi:hypothetical protein